MASVTEDVDGRTVADTASALLGGLSGGIAGAAAFGALMWALTPAFLHTSIPAVYGMEPTGLLGWAIHLLHGAVLGLVFGAIVSRDAVAGVLAPGGEEPFLGPTGTGARLTAAGLVYGLAIWALMLLVAVPTLQGYIGHEGVEVLTDAFQSLLDHMIFGVVLGAVTAVVMSRE